MSSSILLIICIILLSSCNQIEVKKIDIIEKDNLSEAIYCNSNEDCRLILSDCPKCFPCKEISITDSRVVAVNKNYVCPLIPVETICVACVGSTDYDAEKGAICINNKCEKNLSLS